MSTVPADGNMSNFTAWNVEDLSLDMFGGQHPARPTLDFNLDERYEWGGEDARGAPGAGRTALPTPRNAWNSP